VSGCSEGVHLCEFLVAIGRGAARCPTTALRAGLILVLYTFLFGLVLFPSCTPCSCGAVPWSSAASGALDPPEAASQATQHCPNIPGTGTRPALAEERKGTPTPISTDALLRRVMALEERDVLVTELTAKLDAVQRDLMLSKASVSGLSALQDVMSIDKWALGSALQGCLRAMFMARVKACPPRRTARNKRNQSTLTVDQVTVRGAVDQLAAMCDLEMENTRSVGGRVEGRFLRFSGCRAALSVLACSVAETTASLSHSFGRKDGTMTTRLLLERYTQADGKVWYILLRNEPEGTVEVACRGELADAVLRPSAGGPLVRTTMDMTDIPGLSSTCPVVLRWSPLAGHGSPAGSPNSAVPGRVSLVFPVCIVEDAAVDLQVLL